MSSKKKQVNEEEKNEVPVEDTESEDEFENLIGRSPSFAERNKDGYSLLPFRGGSPILDYREESTIHNDFAANSSPSIRPSVPSISDLSRHDSAIENASVPGSEPSIQRSIKSISESNRHESAIESASVPDSEPSIQSSVKSFPESSKHESAIENAIVPDSEPSIQPSVKSFSESSRHENAIEDATLPESDPSKQPSIQSSSDLSTQDIPDSVPSIQPSVQSISEPSTQNIPLVPQLTELSAHDSEKLSPQDAPPLPQMASTDNVDSKETISSQVNAGSLTNTEAVCQKKPAEDHSSDSDTNEPCAPELPSLIRRISLSATRMKTRLQDPPPLAPAVQSQLTRCSSSLLNRKVSLDKKECTNVGDGLAGKQSIESVENNPVPNMSGSMDSKSLVPEDDRDPLDDDVIPASKKRKMQESKWVTYSQLLGLLFLFAFFICSLKVKALKEPSCLGLHLWRWEALILVVFCGRLLSVWIIKILWCLFTATFSWMFKVLAVKVAANSFHRTAYFDRIQECLFNQYILEVLSGPPTMAGITDSANGEDGVRRHIKTDRRRYRGHLFHDFHLCTMGGVRRQKPQKAAPTMPKSQRLPRHVSAETPVFTDVEVGEFSSACTSDTSTQGKRQTGTTVPGPLIARSPIPIEQDKLQELTSDTVSVWTLRRLMKLIRKTNISTYSSIISHGNEEGEINSESQAKVAAKQIFYNMARPGQKTIMMKDFLYFLPEEKAMRAFALFEVTENGEITKKSLAKWVINVYKERRALGLTLSDNKTVVAKLHKVLNVVLGTALIIVFFLIFGVETSKLLVFFSSVFLPSVFVFGNSARSTFESLIFLFVNHPFDVGDRVVVDGQLMLVEEMNVLNTIFLGSTNEKIYYPNALLSQKSISNYYRSPDQGESIDLQIQMKTPVEKLGILKERIQRYVENFPQFWYPDFRVICSGIQDCNKMNIAIWLRHRLNYQDGGERYQRKSNMVLYIKQQLEDLGITYQLPCQEVKVTGIPAMVNPCL